MYKLISISLKCDVKYAYASKAEEKVDFSYYQLQTKRRGNDDLKYFDTLKYSHVILEYNIHVTFNKISRFRSSLFIYKRSLYTS